MAETVEGFTQELARIRAEAGKVVVGQAEVVDLLLACVFGSGHLLLEGVPGLGKTVLVRTVAQVLGLTFGRVQFTPDLMPSDVTGTAILVDEPGKGRAFRFSPGPIFAHVVLADEINRATPKTQSALLEAMQEGQVTILGQTHPLPRPFVVLATQNPVEMEGTYPLPEAQIDRFMFKVNVAFPGEEDLTRILARTTQTGQPDVRPLLDAERVSAFRALVRDVPAADFVVQLAAKLVLATHPDSPTAPELVRRYVRFGVSPRGGQSLLLGAKFQALLAGRTHAAREDVLKCALPAMRHRLVLNFEAAAERVSPDDVVAAVVKAVS